MVYANLCPGAKPNSLLGFGTMRFPTTPDGKIDEALSLEMIDLAYKSGVNYFDTAYPYHGGESERFLKKALGRYPRESYLLADKMPIWRLETPEDMERIFAEQLERCGVEYFDYYLAHSLGKQNVANMRKVDTVAFFQRKKAEGKIRHMGFSFHDDLDCLEDIFSMCRWDFCQLQLNYADWNRFGAKDFYDCACRHGVPIVVMEPVRGGFLANPPEQAAALLRQADPSRSMASWALRYVATLPGVRVILSGMSARAQVEDNLATFADGSVRLTAAEKAVVDQATQVLDGIHTVPCTACRYCMPCPAGVEIPTIFGSYNTARFLGNGDGGYNDLPPAGRGDQCVGCGACMVVCPQHIDIPERLREAHQALLKK